MKGCNEFSGKRHCLIFSEKCMMRRTHVIFWFCAWHFARDLRGGSVNACLWFQRIEACTLPSGMSRFMDFYFFFEGWAAGGKSVRDKFNAFLLLSGNETREVRSFPKITQWSEMLTAQASGRTTLLFLLLELKLVENCLTWVRFCFLC